MRDELFQFDRYDFVDFDFGGETESLLISLRDRGNAVRKVLQETMREAFAKFEDEGEWWVHEDGSLEWDVKRYGAGSAPFWGDEMPIRLEITPRMFLRAYRKSVREIETDKDHAALYESSKARLLAALAKWQTAIKKLRSEVESLPTVPDE